MPAICQLVPVFLLAVIDGVPLDPAAIWLITLLYRARILQLDGYMLLRDVSVFHGEELLQVCLLNVRSDVPCG